MDSPVGAILSRMAASLPNVKVGAIIVAAGASSRMGAAGDKTLADLAGEPLIARTVDVFERCGAVSCVALVVSERNRDAVAAIREANRWSKTLPPVVGGARRQDSVRAGLDALPEDCGWIVVHDGARPFVTPALIEAGLEAAHPTGAAVAVVPAFDTVKRVAPDGSVAETLDRAELRMAQTPQVFRRDVLERAHAEVADDATDDAAMAERIGVEVRTFAGDRGNIKVTTTEDLGVGTSVRSAGAELEVTRMIESEMSTASMIRAEHSSELDTVNTALDRTLQMMKALSPFTPPSDIDEARFNLAVRSLKYIRASIVCIERGYYEASTSLLRSVMEHLLVAKDLDNSENIGLLKKGQTKHAQFKISKMVGRVFLDHKERGIWWRIYQRLCDDVHPSGTYRQQIPIAGGYKASTGSYYYSHAVSFGLLSLAYQLLDLMELVQSVTITARRMWALETDEAYRSLRNLYDLLLPQFTSQSEANT